MIAKETRFIPAEIRQNGRCFLWGLKENTLSSAKRNFQMCYYSMSLQNLSDWEETCYYHFLAHAFRGVCLSLHLSICISSHFHFCCCFLNSCCPLLTWKIIRSGVQPLQFFVLKVKRNQPGHAQTCAGSIQCDLSEDVVILPVLPVREEQMPVNAQGQETPAGK